MVTDVELLRRYEPVVKYTRGEFFFPMAVDPYLRQCDLWAEQPDGDRRLLVRQGALTVPTRHSRFLGRFPPGGVVVRTFQREAGPPLRF